MKTGAPIMGDLRAINWDQAASGLIVPKDMPSSRPTCIDLFAGAGGFSCGMMQAGFEVLAGLENEEAATLIYLVNLGAYPVQMHFAEPADEKRFEKACLKHLRGPDENGLYSMGWVSGSGWIKTEPDMAPVKNFFFGDIRKFTGEQILKALGKKVGEVDCVVGGPPCQGFSRAGKQEVMDPRNSMVFEFARLVLEIQPKTLCMENVPGIINMVTPDGIPVIDAFCRVLEDGGFGGYEALKRSLLATSGTGAALRSKSDKKSKRSRLAKEEKDQALEMSLF